MPDDVVMVGPGGDGEDDEDGRRAQRDLDIWLEATAILKDPERRRAVQERYRKLGKAVQGMTGKEGRTDGR